MQYKRTCNVTVYGQHVTEGQLLAYAAQGISTITTERTLDISDLRITFEIDRDIGKVQPLCKLEVYNLSASSRAKIESQLQRITIEAGYGDNTSKIFDGAIRNIFHRRERTDMITEIYLVEGEAHIGGAITNVSTWSGKTVEQLLRELVADLTESDGDAIAIGEINIASAGDYLQGIVFSTSTKNAINQMADTYDFNWFIDNGSFYAVSDGRILELQKTTTISSETGMMESPTITEEGVNVKTQLNADIAPGRKLKIESTGKRVQLGVLFFYNVGSSIGEGEYKVRRVIHVGDTRGNDWYSDVEAQRIWL